MSKKSSKRRRRSQSTARPAPAAAPAATPRQAAPAAARPAPAVAESKAAASTEDLANEYRYVVGDLKRIGILAAAMFGLLVVLALGAQYVF